MEEMKFIGRNLISREQIEHELASRQNYIKYVQQEFRLDCEKECIKSTMGDKTEKRGCLLTVESLEMEVEEFVLNFPGDEGHGVVLFCFVSEREGF